MSVTSDVLINWREVCLADICDRIAETAQPDPNGNRIYLGLEHLQSGFPSLRGIGIESEVKSGKTAFRSGDILFGKLRPYLQKSVMAPFDGICSTDILVFRAKRGIDSKFLGFLTHTREFVDFAKATQSGVQHPRTSWPSLKSFPITLPPLPEQRKIASVLSLVQQAIEQQERLIALTTELKKALMHKLFTEGLRGEPQKETEIGLIPESWDVVPLGTIAKVGNGATPKRSNDSYWEGGEIPWLNSTKIHDLFVDSADQFVTQLAVKEAHLPVVAAGSILIAITGQGKTLGNSALVRFDTRINQHLAYATFAGDEMVPEFALWYLQTQYNYFRSIAQAGGSTKGALTCGYLKTVLIPKPTRDEQLEIADILGLLHARTSLAEKKRCALSSLFRTLLHQLMTAQIRVDELDLSTLMEAEPALAAGD